MLAIVQFDAASARLLARLLDEGRLPNLAGLRARGTWVDLDAPATQFAAGAQHSLYSGHAITDHGLFYPFQWVAEEQRARYMGDLYAPPSVWEQLAPTGGRTLAVDPYESRPPSVPVPGTQVCGWQLHDRVVLRRWDQPEGVHKRLRQAFGEPEVVDEVFGTHTVKEMLGLRKRVLGAPGRVADATALLLGEASYDLAWVTFCAAHIAGHQFWDLSQLDPGQLDATSSHLLGTTLADVYVAVDAAIGRVVSSLPADVDLMVICPVGMDVNTSRADMLPEMLRAILEPGWAQATAPTSGIWKLRAALPSGLRAKVAGALPEKVALDLTSQLELRGFDWGMTRAFAHPAENQGYIRLNLRGRERDGVVDPANAPALMQELVEGIRTFTDLDGGAAVRDVEIVAERFGTGDRAHQLPDLVVHWTDRPATNLDGVTSPRYGTIRRHGVGSGRSGNHTAGDAWALLVPGRAQLTDRVKSPRLEDIAATALALCGGDPSTTAGEPLLRR